MTPDEAEAIIAVATLAALADGHQHEQEKAAIAAVATKLGLPENSTERAVSGELSLTELSARLTSAESRQIAFDAALSVCYATDQRTGVENAFLDSLANTLGISAANANNPLAGGVPLAGSAAPPSNLDDHILDQAILTAAVELLPDRLANMAILPLQMRMVYGIGQKHGHKLDARQAAELAATFGIGAVAQVFERVVRRTLGGVAGGLLGGLLGGGAGVAAGAAVTFASTYALGHAAEQYYAQNRSLSVTDMKQLFTRFQAEATELYPRVQDRIRQRAGGTSLSGIMQSLRT
ncbi:MAG: hypothetical protein H7Z40_17265 [Phycisphaerae bacterium]|nr:hypothetical protein [Gemmatimonadaceae bacterium]